jgi:RecB family exonuclease
MKLSFSSISSYQNCPLSYKFSYLDKLPRKRSPQLSFGSSIHTALAYLYNVSLPKPPPLEDVLNHLEKVWERDGYQDETEEKLYLEDAKRILTNFYHTNVGDFRVPVALEQKFKVKMDGYTLAGIIDKMDKLPGGGYEIIDYKTSRRLPPKSRVDEDLQLSIYHLAAQEVWGIEPEKLTLYFVIPNQKMSTSRTKKDIEGIKEIIQETIEDIQSQKFEARENPLCPWCDFQAHCPLYKHKFLKEAPPDFVPKDSPSGSETPPGVETSPREELETTDTQIEEVVNEYVGLKNQSRQINERLDELQMMIHGYCESHGLSRLYSDKGIVSRSQRIIASYNTEKLREILEPLGLWEKVLKVDAKSLKEILESDVLEEEVKRMIETAKEVEEITYALYVREIQKEP